MEEELDPVEMQRLRDKLAADPGFQKSREVFGNFFAKHQKKHDELVAQHGPDYDKPAMSFSLNKAEVAVVNAWYESLRPEIMAKQSPERRLGSDEPYYGAVGGALTFSFVDTSLGTIITVKETITGKELNVNDALDWFFYG